MTARIEVLKPHEARERLEFHGESKRDRKRKLFRLVREAIKGIEPEKLKDNKLAYNLPEHVALMFYTRVKLPHVEAEVQAGEVTVIMEDCGGGDVRFHSFILKPVHFAENDGD